MPSLRTESGRFRGPDLFQPIEASQNKSESNSKPQRIFPQNCPESQARKKLNDSILKNILKTARKSDDPTLRTV